MDNYSLSTWILRDVEFNQALDFLAGSNFRIIELSGSGSALLNAWEEDCLALKEQLARQNLRISSLHCSTDARRALASADKEAREDSIAINIRFFKIMQQCGIVDYVLHAGDGPDRSDKARKQARNSLQQLAEEAGKRGIRIAVENTCPPPHPDAYMEGLLELIDGVGDHVGLCHDIGHSAKGGLDPYQEVRTALKSGKLFSLHLHDVNAAGEDHLMPGKGSLKLEKIIDELNQADFNGERTVELKPLPDNIGNRIAQAAETVEMWRKRR